MFLGVACSMGGPAAVAAPAVYFYPPPEALGNGDLVASPLTIALNQITDRFPVIDEMAGVVLMLPWSDIERAPARFDFGLADAAIRYWGARHLKVVLGVSTGGPPVMHWDDGHVLFRGEVPQWLSGDDTTYAASVATIGHHGPATKIEARFPRYWNDAFFQSYAPLIAALGRHFDGNATLSYVRIATGLIGEDSPEPFGPHPEKAPGYRFAQWIAYSNKVVDAYEHAFPHSRLEFDLSFMPWGYTLGDAEDRRLADGFVERLRHDRIFIAFNGWQANALTWLRHADIAGPPLNRTLFTLREQRRLGLPLGLEAVGPMMVPAMQDEASVSAVAAALQPERIVFFGTDAAGIAHVRNGSTAQTATSERYMAGRPSSLAELGRLSIDLLQRLGCRHG